MYSSILSLTLALHSVGGKRCPPKPLLPLGKKPSTYCIGGWVGPRTGLDRCGKLASPPGFDPQTIQPIASCYTNCSILAYLLGVCKIKYNLCDKQKHFFIVVILYCHTGRFCCVRQYVIY